MITRSRQEYRRDEHVSLSVIRRHDNLCVGRVGLRGIDWNWRKVESLAFWIDPRAWNRGYATEAAWFLCRAGFRELRLRRISSQALERNEASLRVLRKLGFVEEGRERASVVIRGRPMAMVLFGLLPRELAPYSSLRLPDP
jgi:ribosomal-protein-alanine N-acetyltransferase